MTVDILKLSGKQLESIHEQGGYDLDGEWIEVEIEIVEEDNWEVEHKCESSVVVFKYEDKYYQFYLTRWGDYWQGYEYDEPTDITEVEKATKTIEYWKVVK